MSLAEKTCSNRLTWSFNFEPSSDTDETARNERGLPSRWPLAMSSHVNDHSATLVYDANNSGYWDYASSPTRSPSIASRFSSRNELQSENSVPNVVPQHSRELRDFTMTQRQHHLHSKVCQEDMPFTVSSCTSQFATQPTESSYHNIPPVSGALQPQTFAAANVAMIPEPWLSTTLSQPTHYDKPQWWIDHDRKQIYTNSGCVYLPLSAQQHAVHVA